ncbi:DNA polymerase III subunit delta' [Blastochloris sulfoviridis]|uniref:DNA polymerase III subunit delta n=1 Tax=Blastochloris sulfoviridis TaxID=50712 RepID=A0A5M6I1S3_9HYPH|nr:DNA polymerase III subunit delta' [Blastochloris sulfoviridis]KAA5602151.1 DNA polymerase III subunit delta' [Blastochloris sulfoviridis]
MKDAPEEGDRVAGTPHPRTNRRLIGQEAAEAAMLEAWRGGQMHHAWLIGGPEGIGKATFAYRVARFMLASGDPAAASLDVPADHPVVKRIMAQSNSDLFVLRRVITPERTTLPSVIPVDEVRKTVGFLGSTAASGGWRVVIVDSLDELNTAGANALLKSLEEPPPRVLFLLIAHRPGRVLATIRSRCRKLMLHPLGEAELSRVLAEVVGLDAETPNLAEAIAASGGSVRRALALLDPEQAAVQGATRAVLARLPAIDGTALHALADRLAAGGEAAFTAFIEAVEDYLAAPLAAPHQAGAARLAAHAEVWDKLARAAAETDAFNLDRKPFVFSVVASLAEAARR